MSSAQVAARWLAHERHEAETEPPVVWRPDPPADLKRYPLIERLSEASYRALIEMWLSCADPTSTVLLSVHGEPLRAVPSDTPSTVGGLQRAPRHNGRARLRSSTSALA